MSQPTIESILADITTQKVDAIHNAAVPQLLDECIKIPESRRPNEPCRAGDAVITGAGELPAKYVIHNHRSRQNKEPTAKNKCLT